MLSTATAATRLFGAARCSKLTAMKMFHSSAMRLGLSGALLALGSLAVTSCGDDDSSPPDARRPPDASQAEDANRPADASQSADASGIDGAPGDAATTDATIAFRCGSFPDSLEPNDSTETAPTVEPQYISENPEWVSGSWVVNACLGGGNEDWYRIPVSRLRFDLDQNFEGEASMRLRGLIEGSDICAGVSGCDGEELPALPENTVTVELYRASDKGLLLTRTDAQGIVATSSAGADYTGDLLVRVSGPPEALYNYRLSIFIDVQGSEDECEC